MPDRVVSVSGTERGHDTRPVVEHTASDFPFLWQRVKVCPVYLTFWVQHGSYGVRRNPDADEDDRGGHIAWEVWHWPTNSAESDWFTFADANRECRRLYAAERWPDVSR